MFSRLLLITACLLSLGARAALVDDMTAAREAARSGDLKTLEGYVSKIHGSPLEPYPRYWLLQARLAQETSIRAEIANFFERYPDSFLADKLRGDWLRVLGKRGEWDTFESEWPKLVNWDLASDLHCYRLQLAALRRDNTMLREAKSLWLTEKSLPEPCALVFDAMFQQEILTQSDAWQRLRLALQAANLELASVLVERLSKPDGIDAKRIREIAAKPKLIAKLNFASRGGRELALFAIGRTGRKDTEEGRSLFKSVQAKLPEADQRYALTRLAYHAARRNDSRALDWFKQGETQNLTAEEADWRLRASLRRGDWNAVAAFIDALPTERQKETMMRYWRGRAYAEAGDLLNANKQYIEIAAQHNFYGLLAKEELGTVADTSLGRYKPNSDELQAARRIPAVQRALALQAMEWRFEGVREWNWAMRGLSDQQLIAAAEVARQAAWYDRAIYSADRTKEIHDFSLRYVSPYRDITQRYAKDLGLDDAWIYGLIRQESRFVIIAKSSVGASGLMQLMPATAKWVARKIGLQPDRIEVNEIGTNVQLGTYYLKHVLDSLGNQPVLATAAYNAGPGRARAWQDNKALEGAIYAETIPFNETRDYVKKVMANAIFYSQAFGRNDISIKKRLGTIPARGSVEAPAGDDTP